MATEGAALANLRDVYYILTHDLVDVPLDRFRDISRNNPTDEGNASNVAPVIRKLALTMLEFNASVEMMNTLTTNGITTARYLIWLDIVLITVVVGVILYVIWVIVWERIKQRKADGWTLFPELSKLVIGGLVFLTFLGSWLIMIRANRDELGHNSDILKTGFWNVHNHVGSAYAMRFEAAVQQGSVAAFVTDQYAYQKYNPGGSTLIPGPDCADDQEDGTAGTLPCTQPIDPCGTSVPTLEYIITHACPNELYNMLDTLQTIKAEGVDSYDRSALWETITRGVDGIRHTIDISANADTTSPPIKPLDATAAQLVVNTQIVPILEDTHLNSQALILQSGKQGTPIQKETSDGMTVIYQTMTTDMLQVMQEVNYEFDISDYRDFLDGTMATFYAAAYPAVRFDLLLAIEKVQKAEDARPPPSSSLYVDAATLIARVKTMGSSAWNELVSETHLTRVAVRVFLSKFKLPRDQPMTGLKVAVMVSVILTIIGFIALALYLADIIHQVLESTLDGQRAARYIIIAACVYALLTVTFNSMINRMVLRSGHNWNALRKNGQLLAHFLDNTELAATDIQRTPKLGTTEAQNYLTAAIGTSRAYDACNSVTTGASMMPFPTMDVVIYLTAVIVIMTIALYGVSELDPRDKLANIKTLMRLQERVKNGEVPPTLVSELQCCTPNNSVWHILYWIAVVVLFILNIYVMTNVTSTNDNYAKSLSSMKTCV